MNANGTNQTRRNCQSVISHDPGDFRPHWIPDQITDPRERALADLATWNDADAAECAATDRFHEFPAGNSAAGLTTKPN